MIQSIREAEEGWKADLLRVFATTCAPFMLYFLYLDMEYSSHIEDSTLMTPLSYVDYLLSHTHDFIIIAFTVFIGSAAVLFGPIFARMRVKFRFDQQISKLTGKLNRTEEDSSLYLSFIQRYKQMSKIIVNTMEYVDQSVEGLSPEVQQDLMTAIKEIAEDLSKGLCSNSQKETLNVRKMLDKTQNHFADYIQSHNIQLQMTCPDNLTVVADPLFTRVIFLNVLGFPICSTQTNGTISVSVSQKNGYADVEIQDSRYVLTSDGKQHLKFPREFLAKREELKQLCFQNDWGCEFKELQGGQFYTKLSIPLEDHEALANNGMGFGFRQ